MRMRNFSLPALLAACLIGLLGAAPASASQLAPPGHSAADQYRESVPGVTGDRIKGSEDRSAEEVLGEETVEELKELGPEGEAAVATITEGAPEGKAGASEKAAVNAVAKKNDGGGGPGQIASVATGLTDVEGGMGPLLPILILTAIVGFTGLAVGRRRRAQLRK